MYFVRCILVSKSVEKCVLRWQLLCYNRNKSGTIFCNALHGWMWEDGEYGTETKQRRVQGRSAWTYDMFWPLKEEHSYFKIPKTNRKVHRSSPAWTRRQSVSNIERKQRSSHQYERKGGNTKNGGQYRFKLLHSIQCWKLCKYAEHPDWQKSRPDVRFGTSVTAQNKGIGHQRYANIRLPENPTPGEHASPLPHRLSHNQFYLTKSKIR